MCFPLMFWPCLSSRFKKSFLCHSLMYFVKFSRRVTRKVRKRLYRTRDDADVTDEAEKKRTGGNESRERRPAALPCYRCNPWLVRFRREGGDDFFEARIAAQRVPRGQQFQLRRSWDRSDIEWRRQAVRRRDLYRQPTQRSSPNTQSMRRAVHCILFHGEQLNRAPAFSQCFLFPPQGGVD